MSKAAGLTTGVPFLFRTVVTFGLGVPIVRFFGQNMEIWMSLAWGIVIAILFYYGWLIHRTRHRLLTELSGSEPRPSPQTDLQRAARTGRDGSRPF
jgi:hypothetical protein